MRRCTRHEAPLPLVTLSCPRYLHASAVPPTIVPTSPTILTSPLASMAVACLGLCERTAMACRRSQHHALPIVCVSVILAKPFAALCLCCSRYVILAIVLQPYCKYTRFPVGWYKYHPIAVGPFRRYLASPIILCRINHALHRTPYGITFIAALTLLYPGSPPPSLVSSTRLSRTSCFLLPLSYLSWDATSAGSFQSCGEVRLVM